MELSQKNSVRVCLLCRVGAWKDGREAWKGEVREHYHQPSWVDGPETGFSFFSSSDDLNKHNKEHLPPKCKESKCT